MPRRRTNFSAPLSVCGLAGQEGHLPSERVLSDAEIGEIWHAASEAASPYGTIIRLLILTGPRRGEVAHVVNFDDGGFCATGDAPRLVAGAAWVPPVAPARPP